MFPYKDEKVLDLVDEIVGRTGRGDEDGPESKKQDVGEAFLTLKGDFSEEIFPIELLTSCIENGEFPKQFLDSPEIFQNVLFFTLSLPDGFSIDIVRPEQYYKAEKTEILQDFDLRCALFFISSVISKNSDAVEGVSNDFIALLIMMIYSTDGSSCQWALHILSLIAEKKLDDLEEFQYVSRVGEVLKYCNDEKTKYFAIQALEPFFGLSEDYKRKKKIFDYIFKDFARNSARLKLATLNMINRYIRSSEKDMKYALRNDLMYTCISLLSPGNVGMIQVICSILTFIITQDSSQDLEDKVTYDRLVKQVVTCTLSTNHNVTIPVYSLIGIIIDANQEVIPVFVTFKIPENLCARFKDGTSQEKAVAMKILSKFMKYGKQEMISLLVENDFIIPSLCMLSSADEETRENILYSIHRMLSYDQSVYESIDYDELMESIIEAQEIDEKNSHIIDMIIAKMKELKDSDDDDGD